ncbi:M20 family peptidase [Paenibacillaceae bacterium]|nr:M20 family peptidase [Paenibacillaceae bacterium]
MLEKQIDQWIERHQDELLRDISLLVSIESVASDGDADRPYGEACARALDTMLGLGEQYGFSTTNVEYRCGVISYGALADRTVGIWGHVDVVPAGGNWLYPPYACTRKGDFLIGRGVQDNKGPSMAVLYALRCIRDLQVPLNYTVKQIVGCAEEAGMDDAVYFVQHHDVPDFNLVADSGFPVCYGEKGIIEAEFRFPLQDERIIGFQAGSVSNSVPGYAEVILKLDRELEEKLSGLPGAITIERTVEGVRLSARGKAGHAAFPQGTDNAIHRLLEPLLAAELLEGVHQPQFALMNAVCAAYDGGALQIACADELSGPLSCVGAVASIVDGELSFQINIRYPITADANAMVRRMTAAAQGFVLAAVHVNEPNYCDKDAPEVQTLNDTYNRVTKQHAEPFVMGGGTYARKIPNAVGFGPGMPADLSALGLPAGHGSIHGPDEVQSIPNLLMALKIYVMSLVALNNVGGSTGK